MASDRPHPVTPFEPFTDVHRSITPIAVPAASMPPPSSRPSTFTREIHDAISLAEQSIAENVRRAFRTLGTLLIERVHESHARLDTRIAAHATELKTLRSALEAKHGVIERLRPVASLAEVARAGIVIEAIVEIFQNRQKLRGLRITAAPPVLRHFTARFEEIN